MDREPPLLASPRNPIGPARAHAFCVLRWLIASMLVTGCAADSISVVRVRDRTLSEGTPCGIDSDGEGGLWIAFENHPVDYYTPGTVRVVHVDANGTMVAHYSYGDTYTHMNGLAFTGDALWLNYGGSFSDDNRIRKVDPNTFEELASFATEVGIVDLGGRPGTSSLVLSNMWNQVAAIDTARGGEQWRARIPGFPEGGTQRGIATDDRGTWVLVQETDEIYVLDDLGHVSATANLPGTSWSIEEQTDHLTWDGAQLLLAHHDQLIWFEVTP
jgi:hypothetical protein